MEYAEHLSRKLSIAVALAVLKEKPQDMSTCEYVVYLQNKIKSSQHEQCMDIDQVSVTSQDFEDVIEDTMMTPVEKGILNNDLLLRGTCKPAKRAVEDIQSKANVQSTFLAESHQLTETDVDCDDLLSANILEDRECGQTVHLHSLEPVGCSVPNIHENNGNHNINVDISIKKTMGLQESIKDYAKNHVKILDDQVFHFCQSQADLFLTQTQADLSVHGNTEEIIPPSNEQTHDIDNLVNSNTLLGKSQGFIAVPQAQSAEKILNVNPVLPESCLTPTQTRSAIATGQYQANIELPAESVDTAPSQTQNTCLELLSQAVDSEVIEIGLGNEEYMDCDSNRSKRGVCFKVLQELENINNVLRELDSTPEVGIQSCLPDSGYRSDGQLSSSQLTLKMAERLEGTQLAQSAGTLIEHVCACPARVLLGGAAARAGAALARLAAAALARGLRPAFLDALQRRAQDQLEAVWVGGEEPLNRDESVFRLMLLTECPDVAACAMEHLLDRLDAFHRALTAEPDSPRDAESVDEVESQCYSFHVLELLLRSYLTRNEMESAKETPELFEEAIQERTPIPKNLPNSISDIWRRRWDPNHKPVEVKAMKTKDRNEILERCGAVLNKFIVGCMDKYSLISFAALECFNCLQPA